MQMFASDALIVYKSGGKIEGGKEEKYEKTTIHDFLTGRFIFQPFFLYRYHALMTRTDS